MKKIGFYTLPISILLFLLSCNKDKTVPTCSTTEDVSYNSHAKAIIDNNCMKCHDAGSDNGEYNTYAGLKTVLDNGKFETEVLVDQSMPRFNDLTQEDLDILQCWLEGGYLEN